MVRFLYQLSSSSILQKLLITGNVFKDSTRTDDNIGRNHTDIVSISIINLDLQNTAVLRDTIFGVVKSFLTRNNPYSPYVQMTTPSPMQPIPQSQIIIVQPPTPQIVFADGRGDPYRSDSYRGDSYGGDPFRRDFGKTFFFLFSNSVMGFLEAIFF